MQKVIELIHNHADQHQNEVVLSLDQSLLSSFSLFLLPISFHLNFEALVPRVVKKLIENAKYKDGWTCQRLSIKSLICFDQGVMTCKILHDLCPENLRHKFTKRSMISEYKAINRGDLQIPKVRLEYAKRRFYFSGVKNWNDIPDNIRERGSITRFRTGLRYHLLNLSQDPNTTHC